MFEIWTATFAGALFDPLTWLFVPVGLALRSWRQVAVAALIGEVVFALLAVALGAGWVPLARGAAAGLIAAVGYGGKRWLQRGQSERSPTL